MFVEIGAALVTAGVLYFGFRHFQKRKLRKLEKQAKKVYTLNARNFIHSKEGAQLKVNLSVKFQYRDFDHYIMDNHNFVKVMLNNEARRYSEKYIAHMLYYPLVAQLVGNKKTINKYTPILQTELRAGVDRYAKKFGVTVKAINIQTISAISTPKWIDAMKRKQSAKATKLSNSGINRTPRQRKLGTKKFAQNNSGNHGGINW